MNPITYSMNNTLVLVLEGEFDAHQVTQWREYFECHSKAKSNVLVDMSEVYFIDSSGIGALVFMYKRLLERGYKLSVLNVKGQPKELFELLHLTKSIRCYETVKEFVADHTEQLIAERVA